MTHLSSDPFCMLNLGPLNGWVLSPGQILGPEIFKRLPPPLAEHQKDLKATYETADGHLVARFRELPLLVLPQRAIVLIHDS